MLRGVSLFSRVTKASSRSRKWGFDQSFYLRNNPDIALSDIDPQRHYSEYGWKEGRDPSDYFSTNGYLEANPDVAAAQVDPLEHFLEHGVAEQRTGWQKRRAEDWCAQAVGEIHALQGEVRELRHLITTSQLGHSTVHLQRREVPIPMTPRASKLFERIFEIARK